MEVDEQDLLLTIQRMVALQAEQANFNNEVTAALTAMRDRLDALDQRLDQISRVLQPRLVETPFTPKADDPALPDQADGEPPE